MSADRRLFVLRHADAVSHGSGLSDAYRPLSARGEQTLPELSQRLAERGGAIAVVHCSAAVRAAATLQGVRGALPEDATIEVSNDLYMAGGDDLLARCRELADDVPAALLIGHNPGVAALVHELAIQDTPVVREALSRGFPPGALAELVVPVAWRELGWATCRLSAVHRPGRHH
ncbi:MAG: SixA phosphatase family protein [Nitriliruptoraceae bacterium]